MFGTNADSERLKRLWKESEQQELIHILKAMVTESLKGDNGFKAGYLETAAERMNKTLPGCNLTAAHVKHRVQAWKKTYGQVRGIATMGGFGWDSEEKNVLIDDNDVWNQYVKCHPEVVGYRYRTWPMHDDWIIIFGTDCADGHLGRCFATSLQHLINKENGGNTRPLVGAACIDEGDFEVPYTVDGENKENIDPNYVNVASGSAQKKQKPYVLLPKRAKVEAIPVGDFEKIMERFVEGTENR